MDSNYFALRNSPANRGLFEIIRNLVQPSCDIEEWLTAHGSQCQCVFCAEGGCPAVLEIEDALNALDWMTGQVAALISGSTPGTPHNDDVPAFDPASNRMEGSDAP